jgi:hypothetical protein
VLGIRSIKSIKKSICTIKTTLLQGVSGSTATVFVRWPYSPETFDRVLCNSISHQPKMHKIYNLLIVNIVGYSQLYRGIQGFSSTGGGGVGDPEAEGAEA